MTVEAYLTRELSINFIDARTIATEAKINLGISGYPTPEQILDLQREAVIIFEDQPTKVKDFMRRQKQDLDNVKESNHSKHNRDVTSLDASSCHSHSSHVSTGDRIMRVVSLGVLGEKNQRNRMPGMNPKRNSGGSSMGSKNASFGSPSSVKKSGSYGSLRLHGSRGKLGGFGRSSNFNHKMLLPYELPLESLSESFNDSRSRLTRLGSILDIKVPAN